jgi:Domain of unknown function (DUF4160)
LAKVEAFSINGLKLLFYSNDHRPPHFHAKKDGCWEIRVRFLTCSQSHLDFEYKFPKNPQPGRCLSSKEEQTLMALVLEHRSDLLREWESKVCKEGI